MEVNLYIEFWTLKMKCTRYGLYGQVAFKNARAIFFLSKLGQSGQGTKRHAQGGAQPWANAIQPMTHFLHVSY